MSVKNRLIEEEIEGRCPECGAELPERPFRPEHAEIYGAALRMMKAKESRLEEKIDTVIAVLTKVLNEFGKG